MKRMKTSSTCVSEKSFCFTRSLLSVGNKHKFCGNFPCFKSESHFYPWKQSQILGKIKNKKLFRRKFSFSTILLFRSLVPWVRWIVLWMVIFVLNRKSSVIPHVSLLLPVIYPVTRVFETVPNVISFSHALTNSRIYVHRPNTFF